MDFALANVLIWGRRAPILSKLWTTGILCQCYRFSSLIVQPGLDCLLSQSDPSPEFSLFGAMNRSHFPGFPAKPDSQYHAP